MKKKIDSGIQRRDFLKSGLGLVAILSAGESPAVITKSIIAARAALTGAVKWRNPYVTDGLVAMWDGEWNVGGGVHDAAATVWKDLVGTNDLTLTQYGSFDQNSFGTYIRTGITAQWSAIGSLPAPFTSVEMCGIKYVDGFIMSSGQQTDARMLIWSKGYIQTLNPYEEGFGDGSSLPDVGTISGVHGQEGVKGYFNGNTLARLDTQNNWTAVRRNSSIAICGTSGNYEYRNYLWSGRIYNLRLYSRALTAEEIAANYTIDKERFGLA